MVVGSAGGVGLMGSGGFVWREGLVEGKGDLGSFCCF